MATRGKKINPDPLLTRCGKNCAGPYRGYRLCILVFLMKI